jgi:beta-fructofuranosidase
MYYGLRDFQVGDVNVIKHDGVFHLFHLTLPNHAYIAHAVSRDGLKWRRVKNALFISDPQAWDDDMLWTMHVSPDPYRKGAWRMFYTGLCLEDRGRIQRVGMARSNDLYYWEKDASGTFPLEIPGSYYEHELAEGRHWVSFRDPFCYQENGETYLLAAARSKSGPLVRRGCVALVRESAENQYEFLPPLFRPMQYDDLEVPNLARIGNRYYLVGSIREDVKVHYWWADSFEGPYRNFSDNVLLPQGNYAARLSTVESGYLVWNFFTKGLSAQRTNLMAPPKELAVDEHGELKLKSFQGFEQLAHARYTISQLTPVKPVLGNDGAKAFTRDQELRLASESGCEAFLLKGDYRNFMLTGTLDLEKRGKCGLVLRTDENGDGYYLSLELYKGIAQIRAWGRKPGGAERNAFRYDQLQAAHYIAADGPHAFRLIAFEQYIEFSLNGYVLLTLADDEYAEGGVGFYVESALMRVSDLALRLLGQPPTESYPESLPNY